MVHVGKLVVAQASRRLADKAGDNILNRWWDNDSTFKDKLILQ